jgi:hypothetical protein
MFLMEIPIGLILWLGTETENCFSIGFTEGNRRPGCDPSQAFFSNCDSDASPGLLT